MDKYVIEKKIGQGSYGGVFIVHLKSNPQKRYVLKRIPLNTMNSKEKKSAEQEVLLLQKLQHPNIVRYKDSFLDNRDKDLCIVMRHCEGGDLSSKIKEYRGRSIPESIIMKWFVQIALALDFIHNRKVLHRDLKSQNVFLTKEGQIKLGDFGIARVLNRTVDMAQTYIGTPLYMSPECCNNRPYSFKSDVWSLGCILYEMCSSGKHPFNARDLNGLFMKIIRGSYTPVQGPYSNQMKQLVSTMLSTTPQKRPTVSRILKFTGKNVVQYVQEFEIELNKNANVNASLDMERVELNNLKLQVNELEINEPDVPQQIPSSRPESKVSNAPSSEQDSRKLQAPSYQPPYVPLSQRQKKPVDINDKIKYYQQEKQKYQQAIIKIQEHRAQDQKKAQERAVERPNKMQEMRDQRKARENEIRMMIQEKQKRAEMQRNNIKQQRGEMVKQKSQNSAAPAPQKLLQNQHHLKQVQIEKERWQNEVERIEREIERVKDQGKEAPIISNREPPQLKYLSDKERVLAEKERKRKEEEEIYNRKLKEERIQVHRDRIQAQRLNYDQYHDKAPAHPRNNVNNNGGGLVRKNSTNEDEREVELLSKLNDKLLRVTRKLDHLEKTSRAEDIEEEVEEDSESDYEDIQLYEQEIEEEGELEEDDRDDKVRLGRLGDRAKFIRNQCVKLFGKELFEKMYAHIKMVNDRNIHDENDQKRYKRLVSVLGMSNAKLVDYCHLIEELLFVEGSMM